MISWIKWFSSLIGGIRNTLWIYLAARHVNCTTFRWFFPRPAVISSHTCWSVLRWILQRNPLQISGAVLSSSVICPIKYSHFQLPSFSTISSHLRKSIWPPQGSSFLVPWPRSSLCTVTWGIVHIICLPGVQCLQYNISHILSISVGLNVRVNVPIILSCFEV